jgi:hypothetical protein
MMKLFRDTLETYWELADMILVFGVVVFAVMLFLLSASTFSAAGAGFMRYMSILTGELGFYEFVLLEIITLLSIFALSFLVVSITLAVKLRRSMDDIGFRKIMSRFPKYTFELTLIWVVLGAVSLAIGVFFSLIPLSELFWTLLAILSAVLAILFGAMAATKMKKKGFIKAVVFAVFFLFMAFFAVMHWANALVAWIMLLLWAFFIFVPQTLILGEKELIDSLRASAEFFTKRPMAIVLYYLTAVVLLLVMITIEVVLGRMRIFLIPQILSAAIMFLFAIPVLEILKANVYLTRYKLLLSGLK